MVVLTRTMNDIPQDITDLPFITTDPARDLPNTPENNSPTEESFRHFLQSRLSRHKAPQALRERIKNNIQQMPD